MGPYLRSASFQLYPYPEDLGASRSHLRETQLFQSSSERYPGFKVKTLKISRREQSSQGSGREAPLRRNRRGITSTRDTRSLK